MIGLIKTDILKFSCFENPLDKNNWLVKAQAREMSCFQKDNQKEKEKSTLR